MSDHTADCATPFGGRICRLAGMTVHPPNVRSSLIGRLGSSAFRRSTNDPIGKPRWHTISNTADGWSLIGLLARRAVPTANSTLVTIVCESADYRCDEGLVQLDLVGSGRPGPVTGGAAS